MKAFFEAIANFFKSLFSSKPKEESVKTIGAIIKTRNHGEITLPAVGKFVCESHYAIKDVQYGGRNFPSTKDLGIDAHLNDSISALKKWFPNVTKEEIYNNSWERQWTPANDGTINEFGQGSLGDVKPSIEEEIWQGNMYFVKNPGKDERFLLTNPKTKKSCVIQMAYEQGPGSTTFLGGVVPEVQWYLGADNETKLTLEKVEDGTPLGPVTGKVETKPAEPTVITPPTNKALYYPKAVIPNRSMTAKTKYADGYPKGAIVHFTAGQDRTEQDALDSYNWGCDEGYVFFVIGPTGKVYQGFPLSHGGSHAGTSKWPGLGESVSSKLVGIEVACAGRLEGNKAWFGRTYQDSEIRAVTESYGCPAGNYKKFTEAQEQALIELLVWLKKNNPGVFNVDYILGHHEVSGMKGIGYWRKNDPGGSLSITMDQLRAKIKKECK